MADSAMLSRQEVADRLAVNKQWLIRNATEGPDFYKLPGGTIRYSEIDLNNWLKQRKVNS